MRSGSGASLFVIGRFTGSFGMKGFIGVEPMTHSVERYRKLDSVYVGTDEATATKLEVEHVDFTRKGIRLKLRSVSDRTAADKLSGMTIFVDELHRIPPPKGSYFVHDIIGCTVLCGSNPVGKIVDVYLRKQGLAQDVWVIEHTDGLKTRRHLLPAVPDFLQEVNLDKRTVIISRMVDLS